MGGGEATRSGDPPGKAVAEYDYTKPSEAKMSREAEHAVGSVKLIRAADTGMSGCDRLRG